MTLAENLKNERKKLGYSQKEFAEKLNMNARTYASYERGERDISTAVLLEICKALDISSDKLLDNVPKSTLKTSVGHILDNKDIRMIPVFESVSAGFGAYADEKIIEYIPLHIQNSYDADNMLAIKVIGNSMYPKIEDGDIIAVRKQSDFENGQIAVVLVDGDEGLVKKIYQEQNKITLVSCNPEYPDKVFIGEEIERLSVVGVVNMIIKRV